MTHGLLISRPGPFRSVTGAWRCRRAATVTEYSLAVAAAIAALGAVGSPRFQSVKDMDCAPQQIGCQAAEKGREIVRRTPPAPAAGPRVEATANKAVKIAKQEKQAPLVSGKTQTGADSKDPAPVHP